MSNINTGKHLPRRTVLRGLGAAIALPLLDSMVPALRATRASAAARVRRFGAIYVGMGMNMPVWNQPEVGKPLTFNPILAPIETFKDRVLVVSGCHNERGEGLDGGAHPRVQTYWMTGCRANRSEGGDLRAGTSLDQIIARQWETDTQLASLELAIEPTHLAGACALGYSCAYNNTIVWRTPTTPLPMENNPRNVFERLFGASDSTEREVRLRDIQTDRSVLDSVTGSVSAVRASLGAGDRAKLTEYLDAVRDVERRVTMAEQQVDRELPVVDRPIGIPDTYGKHVELMFDLQTLAFQTDLTRVFTFLMGREASVRTYPEIDIREAHHSLSHHSNAPEQLAKQARLNAFQMQLLKQFVEKLAATPDGDGTLLDSTLLLYGSGMSDSHLHVATNVPTLLVHGSRYGIEGDRHLHAPDGTPLANLQLTLLDKLGVDVEHFGDSTGELRLVTGV